MQRPWMNPKTHPFLLDDARHPRVKIRVAARVLEDDPALFDSLRLPGLKAAAMAGRERRIAEPEAAPARRGWSTPGR